MEPVAENQSAAAIRSVADLVRGFSIESTFPTQPEIDSLRNVVPQGTHVYLACPPTHSPERLVDFARAVREAGLEPVPHITARSYSDAASLEGVLARLSREANVQRALVLAGDRDVPAGPFAGALDVIESDLLQASGIRAIGISGYPDGHPKIDEGLLGRSLLDKLEAAGKRNLAVHIATQFCFDEFPILGWLRWLRETGVTVPVRVGVAGPTSMRSLMRFALRCGVRASLRGVTNPKALQLFGQAAPDGLIRNLGEAGDRPALEPLAIHFFSFGGLLQTAEWAMAAASGDIEPQAEGFRLRR